MNLPKGPDRPSLSVDRAEQEQQELISTQQQHCPHDQSTPTQHRVRKSVCDVNIRLVKHWK